jgi:hypothetical protein
MTLMRYRAKLTALANYNDKQPRGRFQERLGISSILLAKPVKEPDVDSGIDDDN